MSISPSDAELATRLPLDRIHELCRRHEVSQLFVSGPILEREAREDDEIRFLVMFQNDDFGPWGCKLDLLENDLSGALHRKVHVSSRRGIQHSTPSPWREQILDSARLIHES
jgi:predicted nucleotidyltransferase